jgi:hypothetical protein
MRTDPVNWSHIAGRAGHCNVRRKQRLRTYGLRFKRWRGLLRFLEDGNIEMDTDSVERAMTT